MTVEVELAPLEARASALVEAARKAGADSADAVVVKSASLAVQVRKGQVEETERAESDDFGLRVFVGRRSASVSANVLDDIDGLAARAVAMARAAPEDPYAGLADAALLSGEILNLDLLDPSAPDADALTEAALALEAAALEVSGVTQAEGASADWGLSGLVLATSHGFLGSTLASRRHLMVSAIAGEGTGMERDYDYDAKTHVEDLASPEKIGRRAGERAVNRLNPRKLSSQRANIVFEPRQAAGLVRAFTGAINGASIARKTSFLQSAMGTQVFARGVTITDDPYRRRGLRSRPFDGEGVAGSVLALVEDGVLQHWLLDSASARELGLTSNGRASRGGGAPSPGTTNLIVSAGEKSPDAMMAELGTGLYVTEMIGHGVNPVTGDYSRGAAGFWFENGEPAYPVSEITVAGNLKDMFARAVPADDPEDLFGVTVPTLAIEDLTIAGQ